MKVLKFGGSSVASAENINRVVAIVRESLVKDRLIVVVSAMGGITDILIQCGVLASQGDESYKLKLKEIENRHLETIKLLIPVAQQSSVLSQVKKSCNEIEDICNGVFLLGELSDRTKDRIVSYGELITSSIISLRIKALGVENTWKDSRELIITDSNFTYATVDFHTTNKNISGYFSSIDDSLFIM